MQTLWPILGLVFLVALACRVVLARRRERKALEPLAAEYHLHYAHEDLIGIQERYQNLLLIRRGHNRHVSHLLYGSSAGGPTTLFCYTYELGFGTNSENRQWWVAVVETPRAHRRWRAEPADLRLTPAANAKGDLEQTIDGYRFGLSSGEVFTRLTEAGVGKLLANAPLSCSWEVQGPLVAVATPFNLDPRRPRLLFEAVCGLARFLEEHDL